MLGQLLQHQAFERFPRTARIASYRQALVFAWPLAFRAGPYLCFPSVSRSVSQPLPDDALQSALGALSVIYSELDAIAMAEIELADISVQMLLRAVLVDTLHSALENAVISLSRIDFDLYVGDAISVSYILRASGQHYHTI